jgi:predicted  nucleic acid-binding Zn-ribbon protein
METIRKPKLKRRGHKVRVQENNLMDSLKQLAKDKLELKALEKKIKENQEKILSTPNHPDELKTEYGTLSLRKRENWDTESEKEKLIAEITLQTFKKYATISKSNIVKAVGEKGFLKLKNSKLITLVGESQFYQLNTKKS